MFRFFSHSKGRTFNVAAIGNHWITRPLTHDGVEGTLHVRQVPSDVKRTDFGVVALAWMENAPGATDLSVRTKTIQAALEESGNCLLTLVHETPQRSTWYAYASSQDALDRSFASLDDPSLRWGVNDDRDWLEYDNARGLVGA